jgi:hypothetical protein
MQTQADTQEGEFNRLPLINTHQALLTSAASSPTYCSATATCSSPARMPASAAAAVGVVSADDRVGLADASLSGRPG